MSWRWQICVFLLVSFAALTFASDTWIAVLSPDAGEPRMLLERKQPVIGSAGDYPILMTRSEYPFESEITRFPLDGSRELLVASGLSSQTRLPEIQGLTIRFAAPPVYIVEIAPDFDVTHLTKARFDLRAIHPRVLSPTRSVRLPRETMTPDPLIQEMVDNVSMTAYQDVTHDLVDSWSNRYSCSGGFGVQASQFIFSEFASYGYTDITYQSFDSCSDNVIATKPGLLNPDRVWVIGGHYDSYATGTAPGADDNASGTACVLEIARVLAGYDFEDTIVFVLFASEERGLYGSEAYASAAESAGTDIIGMINLDMLGYLEAGDTFDLDVVADSQSMWLETQAFQAIQDYLPSVLYKDNELPFGASSDHASFNDHGFSAIMFFEDEPEYSPYIHTANDTIGLSLNNWDLAITFVKASLATLATGAVPSPQDIYMLGYELDDSSGDSDGVCDPGESVSFVVTLKNNLGQTAQNVQAVLSCTQNCTGVTIVQNTSDFGTMMQGTTSDNSSNPFQVYFDTSVPQWTEVQFRLNISASGPYINTGEFTETVTSAVFTQAYIWNMDMDPGWTVSGGSGDYRWNWGVPTGQGGEYGEPDPTSGYTGSNVYGYNLNGDYQNSMAEQTLTTAPIDCSQIRDAVLDFHAWLGVEQPSYDHARVRVSNNGTTWTEVWGNTATMSGGSWIHYQIDVSEFADQSSQFQVRWTMGPTDSGWRYCGWNIDDVSIWGWALPAEGTPTPGPSTTPTSTRTPTIPPTFTPTSPPVTSTPTTTSTPTMTPTTAPGTPTSTQIPTNTPTTIPTNTPIPTFTPLPSPTAVPNTPTPTPPPPPTDTPVATGTPVEPSATSEPTSPPTETPLPDGAHVEIRLNAGIYKGMDPFELSLQLSNNGTPIITDLYLLLDVFGNYYFYPGWTTELQAENVSFPDYQVFDLPILSFIVPDGLDPSGPYWLYSAMFRTDSFDLVSNVATGSFRFE